MLDKDEIRIQIEELIAKSEIEISELEELTKPIGPENSIGRVSRMDAINNKSVLEASLRNKKRKLSKLNVALRNIDKENFGICVYCKNNINPKRLMLLPESDRCIRCAAR